VRIVSVLARLAATAEPAAEPPAAEVLAEALMEAAEAPVETEMQTAEAPVETETEAQAEMMADAGDGPEAPYAVAAPRIVPVLGRVPATPAPPVLRVVPVLPAVGMRPAASPAVATNLIGSDAAPEDATLPEWVVDVPAAAGQDDDVVLVVEAEPLPHDEAQEQARRSRMVRVLSADGEAEDPGDEDMPGAVSGRSS
jgi:hypothetical protein